MNRIPALLWSFSVGCMALLAASCESAPQETTTANPPTTSSTAPAMDTSATAPQTTLVFFGNSLTAGYGVELSQAFPSVLQTMLDSVGAGVQVVNAGLSGETTSGGLNRVDWILDQYEVDAFVLELGANDGLRGIDPAQTQRNLQAILDRVREVHPEARLMLTGMEALPNMGAEYTQAFRSIFEQVAAANPEVVFVPFLLEGVGGEPALNQDDGIHPNAAGHRQVAQHLWPAVLEVLRL